MDKILNENVVCTVLERLDATLDIYDQDYGRRQSITPFNHLSLSSSKPTAGATMHVTTAELHQPPLGARDNVVLPIEPPVDYLPQLEPEPEPDYDMDDTQELPPPPPPLDMHSSGLNLYVDAPIPPPLPVSAGVPYQYSSGSSSSSLTADNGSSKASEAARRSAIADDSRQRDQAHAALMAAVLRRRNLLESTEGNQIADKIENRVQRSKMLQQTIYRADQSAAETRRSSTATAAGDESSVKSGAGTSSIGGATSDAVNFSAEAERARLDFVRKSASHPALGSSTTSVKVPPPKPQRPDRVSGSVGLNTGQVQPRMGTGQPPGQPGATVGAVVRAPENNVGIMTSNYSPAVNPSNGLKIETYDELSLMSSVSTASTSSSVDHEGSPSHSSSGDSGYAKSMSASPHGDGEQLIIAPPAEFATATVIADVITTPATPAGGLRSVIKQQSNSIVFPARARVSQK